MLIYLTSLTIHSVAPPIDVFVIYVDGISAVQLTDTQEFTDVVFNVEAGRHTIDFSYQYNIFDVDPLPPSPENRLGMSLGMFVNVFRHLSHIILLGIIWIDNVSIEPVRRKFKVFRHLPISADQRSFLFPSAGSSDRHSKQIIACLLVIGCALTILFNRN